ncbi:hypothetical protein [Tropicibacter naphthalenivorans]|uniref:Uncharacterized protein n=1 Tax=Tropicibacter naphthalenivorans TaxID=441103 RepID=A0A0P1GK52_9RHOB|nr:hypothetical protein [Tropicibacter naphthalenivorans]CUH82544.1 hypothetical protein TRN7648_04086 [Tropicibacter naphthalenivorans]SMD09841.1 hypothetical protein SAMN04488093_12016 [Tropicibacter naphthalenivorans]
MDDLELYDDALVIDGDYHAFDEDYDDDDFDEDEYDPEDALESMLDDDYDEGEDLGELFGIGKRRRRRRRAKKTAVTTAKRARANVTNIAKANTNIQRNAMGIKQINSRLASVNRRVGANARATRIQSMQIRKINKMQKALGVMEFVQAYDAANNQIDIFQLLKGAVASGMLGGGKGAMHNPYLLGAAGLFLRANNGNFGGLLGSDVKT